MVVAIERLHFGDPKGTPQHMMVIRQGTVSSIRTKNCTKIKESLRVCLSSEQDITMVLLSLHS